MDAPEMIKLIPHRWTPIPDTNLVVRWDGEQEVIVWRCGGFWNLAPLVRLGRVLAWARLADRPDLGSWPIMPLTRRNTYGARGRRP